MGLHNTRKTEHRYRDHDVQYGRSRMIVRRKENCRVSESKSVGNSSQEKNYEQGSIEWYLTARPYFQTNIIQWYE